MSDQFTMPHLTMPHLTMPHLNVRHFAVGIQSPDRFHEVVKIAWGQDHEVEVVVSPTGRSVQVFVDGEKR